ncbi:four helix bundle protein [Psychrobacillus sp. FSL K6-1415]|uniref:four helix bundle protein n=1 Tax=Psychrobacillus sp. FSL K6-1415 TaxID=2921544 RepID=UPI0030F58A61
MRNPKELEVTKRIRKLSKEIYTLSMTFPKHELYELGSQLRRAMDSSYLNLFEGNTSIYPKTYIKHLDSSINSLSEISGIFDLILDRGYITSSQYGELEKECKEIQYVLRAILNKTNYRASNKDVKVF